MASSNKSILNDYVTENKVISIASDRLLKKPLYLKKQCGASLAILKK